MSNICTRRGRRGNLAIRHDSITFFFVLLLEKRRLFQKLSALQSAIKCKCLSALLILPVTASFLFLFDLMPNLLTLMFFVPDLQEGDSSEVMMRPSMLP